MSREFVPQTAQDDTQDSDESEMPQVVSAAFTLSNSAEKVLDYEETKRDEEATLKGYSDSISERSSEISKQKCTCVHKSPRICYGDLVDVEVIEAPEKSRQSSDVEERTEAEELEKCLSTKVFMFNNDEQPDMEKCMKFWNNIVKESMKSKLCSGSKKKKVKSKTKDKSKDQDDMWLKAYEDLKRKNLDKVKLGQKNKCNFWHLTEFNTEDPFEKIREKQDIEMLSYWSPAKNTSLDQITARRLSVRILERYFTSDASIISSKYKRSVKKSISKTLSKKSNDDLQETRLRRVSIKPEHIKEKSEEPKKPEQQEPRPRRVSIKPRLDREDPCLEDEGRSMSQRYLKRVSLNLKHEKVDLESTSEVSGNIRCCTCGCEVDDCTCKDVTLEDEDKEQDLEDRCLCNCGVSGCICKTLPEPKTVCLCGCNVEDCICEKERDKKDCRCGCDLADCICDKLDFRKDCSCGCGLDECICQNIKIGKEECFCGCGIEDCICESPFKRCSCGFDDCKCYQIALLGDFVRNFEDSKRKSTSKRIKLVDVAIQCGHKRLSKRSTEEEVDELKPSHYCAICGHYNCFCKTQQVK